MMSQISSPGNESPSKKLSKILSKSPTKKSHSLINKISQPDIPEDLEIFPKPVPKAEDGKDESGKKNLSTNIADVGVSKLPYIVSILCALTWSSRMWRWPSS